MNLMRLTLLLPIGLATVAVHGWAADRSESEELGRQLFQQRCSVCHTRATLSVKTPYGPVLSSARLDGEWEKATRTVLNGHEESGMPAFKYGMSDSEVDAMIDYLQTDPTFMSHTLSAPPKIPALELSTANTVEVLLSGNVKSLVGDNMEGVPVSAKADGSNMTTTVFTDKAGEYYFPPLPSGKYSVWAQTQAYETSKRAIDLAGNQQENYSLKPLQDYSKQLSGDQWMTALPEATPSDKRLKGEFKSDCTGCHEASYVLQNRFDEAGWTDIIDVMKHIIGLGPIAPIDQAPLPMLQYQEKELAQYLAKARGPGESPWKPVPQSRPTGEAARAVFTEYDVPIDWSWDQDVMGGMLTNNGADWSLGNPSALNGGRGVHDVQADLNGDIWFSYNGVSVDRTIGKIDAKTGKLTNIAVPGAPGLASMGHSLVLGPDGKIWFNINPRGPDYQADEKLGGIDPKKEKVEVYSPPDGMPAPGGAVTMAVDGKGFVWMSSTFGALRFDTRTHEFRYFASNTRVYEGVGASYGVAGDRDGNGWWAQFYSGLDRVSKGDIITGKTLDVNFPSVPGIKELFDADQLEMYKLGGSDQEASYPWLSGPRRMGADKNADLLWVGCYWGGDIAKIDTHSLKIDIVHVPGPYMAPYALTVDDNHNVWTTFMNSDQIGKYNPATGKWVMFRYPSLGTDVRWVSTHKTPDGRLELLMPYFTSHRIARMMVRSEAEIAALKAKSAQAPK
jgi:streptogramin lyase/mono/diheme cytochrome c family protein